MGFEIKKRRHHNTKGLRQIKRGKTSDQVGRMAKKILKKDTMKPLNLKAEIIRLKTELEDREIVIAELRKAITDHVTSMDHIMNGPASFSRGQKIAQLVSALGETIEGG